MEIDPMYYGADYACYEEQVDYSCGQAMMQSLQERKHRLMMNLQTYPFQRHEIESQIRQVEREIQQCVEQFGPNVTALPFGYPKSSGHSSYMSPVDSAIASGATSGVATKAASVVADGDLEKFEDEEQYPPPPSAGYGYQGYPDQMLRGPPNEHMVQGRADRVHMTMFPEESVEVPSTQMMPNQQNNLQRMSQCTQILQATLSNLAAYQGSTEMTTQALPSLANLLTSKVEESTLVEAAKLMLELSKKEPSMHAIANSDVAVSSVIKVVAYTTNLDVQKFLSGTLHNISNGVHGQLRIYNCGGIPCLVHLLSSQVNPVLFYAITTLHNILLHLEPAKAEVRASGGMETMVHLLGKENRKFLAVTADCLHLLAYGHQDSKLIILNAKAPARLVQILMNQKYHDYEKLLWTCSRLLKVLSVCPNNKSEIVQTGVITALAMHLGHSSTRLVQNSLFTIRNLSDAVTKQDHSEDLLRQLIMLLSSNDLTIVTCSAGVLSNLTANNAKNKTIVCQLQGVTAFLKAIHKSQGREEIIEASVCALRHLTSRHPSVEVAQNVVRQQNGIPLITNFLQQHCKWPLKKALLGLVRNLALSPENLPILRESHTVEKVWNVTMRATQELYAHGHGVLDGVYMAELLEVCVTALRSMMKDVAARAQLRHLNSIPTFVQMLCSGNQALTRVAAGILCDLSQDPEGVLLIEQADASTPLTTLLSKNEDEGVAAYAASVLFCLSETSRKQQQQMPGDSMHQQQQQQQQQSFSHFNTGYTTPNDVSEIVTPDLDLPIDFDDFNGLPAFDNFGGFPQNTNGFPPQGNHGFHPQGIPPHGSNV